MMVFELWFAGEEEGKGDGAEGGGKDSDALSIFTLGLAAGLASWHLTLSNTMLANR